MIRQFPLQMTLLAYGLVLMNAAEAPADATFDFVLKSIREQAESTPAYQITVQKQYRLNLPGSPQYGEVRLTERGVGNHLFREFEASNPEEPDDPSQNYTSRSLVGPKYSAFWSTVGNKNAYIYDHSSPDSMDSQVSGILKHWDASATQFFAHSVVRPGTALVSRYEEYYAAGPQQEDSWEASLVEGRDGKAYYHVRETWGEDRITIMEYLVDPNRNFNIVSILARDPAAEGKVILALMSELEQMSDGAWYPAQVEVVNFSSEYPREHLSMLSIEALDGVRAMIQERGSSYLAWESYSVQERAFPDEVLEDGFNWKQLGLDPETQVLRVSEIGNVDIFIVKSGELIPIEFLADSQKEAVLGLEREIDSAVDQEDPLDTEANSIGQPASVSLSDEAASSDTSTPVELPKMIVLGFVIVSIGLAVVLSAALQKRKKTSRRKP